ncbi:PREDICTED: pentatricopeptide repeat-containing protein At4g36680, mitochondrial-like [Ipomoea nil]|uniref:pentatricopeptide repeat-containing protein At4g36680, mitochondrial-like n=1 Tax=Ipomoea nil TaxID=35883 RepID=UPI000900D4DD|nr:PREDICTED: pentatricopeptide repeat-containing protein At4g36680, mitochondrial-like [Ipomoea nil]
MSSLALRYARHLSTTAAAAAAGASITISQAKSKLRCEHDPDEALKIYSSISGYSASRGASRLVQTYTVRRLARACRFSEIETLLESHKKDPKVTQEPFLSALIRSYGIVGMFDRARSTYEQMDELGTPRSSLSFNALLTACVNSRMCDRVPQLFDEIPNKYGISPDKISYGILINSYCEVGSPDLAIERLNEMEEKGIEITPITFTAILHSLYKSGRSDDAEKAWEDMARRGIARDVGAYNVKLFNIHGGDPAGVKALIEEMKAAGVEPNTISYNYLMICYCRNGMMDEAEKVYRDLERNGGKPNSATYGALIHYLCEKGRFVTGYKVFMHSVRSRRMSNFYTLKPLLEGLAKESRRKEARGLLRTGTKNFPPNLQKAWSTLGEQLGLEKIKDDETKKRQSKMYKLWRG